MAATSRTVKAKFDGEARGLERAAKDGERAIDKFGKNTERSMRQSGDRSSRGFLASLRRGFGKVPAEGESAGGKTGKRFGAGLKKWVAGEGGGLFKQIGENGGTVFGSGILGAIKTPILGPALIAAVGGAVAVAAPAVGAIAGAGLVAGFGAGIAGLGIVAAAKSEVVGAAWEKTMSQAGADVQLLSRPFESTLTNVAGYFSRTVDKFNPHLAKSFESMAPVVDRFADRFLASTERLIPALDPLTRGFETVLDSLGPGFDAFFDDLNEGLTGLAESVDAGGNGLADFVAGTGDLIRNGLQLITVLNDANSQFETLTGGTSLVDVTMAGLNSTLAPLIGLFSGLSKGLELVDVAAGKTNRDVDGAGQSMSDAANNTAKLAAGLGGVTAAAQHGDAPMRTLAERMDAAKKKADAQAKAFEDLIQKIFRVQNLSLGLAGAEVNLEAALDAATASIKENGRTLDTHTEKGRANKQSLIDVAQSANAQTEAMLRAGKGNDAAGLAAGRSRANFVKLAMQMGATKPQAEAMAKSMIAIPNVSRTAKLMANKRDLDAKLAAANKALKDPNLTKTRKAELRAEIAQLLAAKATAQAAIDSLRGKTVNLNVNTYARRIESTTVGGIPAGIKAPKASGGYVGPGRRWVGERGPEILELGQNQTGRIVNGEGPSGFGAGSSSPTVAEIHIEIGGEVVRVVRTEMKTRDRDLKRKVSAR